MKRPEPVLVTHLFPEIHQALIDLLRALSPDEWGQPTACEGWTVKDIALHLLGGEIGNLSRRRDGHSVGLAAAGWDQLVDSINNWNQSWVEATRRISTPLLIQLLDTTGIQMYEFFQSLDPFEIAGPVSWAGDEPAPVWLDLAREYTERWHHQQHIRDAVGRSGLADRRYMGPVIAAFVRAMPRALGQAESPAGTTVSLIIGGPSGGTWTVRKEGSGWLLYQGAPAQPSASVSISDQDAWRLFTCGLDPGSARERSDIAGDGELAARIFDMVAIIA